MTFEEALAGLTGNKDIEPVYAYASHPDRGWLVRMNKTSKGNASLYYTTGVAFFEGQQTWFKIYRTAKQIREQLDWSYLLPTEWCRIENLGFDPDKECQKCVHHEKKGSSYCWEHCKYTSPIMSCPQYKACVGIS